MSSEEVIVKVKCGKDYIQKLKDVLKEMSDTLDSSWVNVYSFTVLTTKW